MKKQRLLVPVLSLALLAGGPMRTAPAATPNLAKVMGTAMADVVERVMPSVVVVRTEATRYRLAQDWYFGQLYRIPERLAGQGSGVIISKDGFILTNRHVVEGAQEIEVVLNDGTKYAADLIGEDSQIDLAVLRVKDPPRAGFPCLEPGNSDALRVGEFVMALGSPFSLSSSVTLGIVSQKGRAIGALPYEDFIQTDAAVNQGNSGGPLVDMDGKLVGINTMIQTAGYSQGNIGISFAIPVNLAMTVAQAIMKDGDWKRPWIGILMEEHARGVTVARVVPGSPAAQAGLAAGDLILRVNDQPAENPRAVQRIITGGQAGDPVALHIERDGQPRDLKMVTEPMPMPDRLFRE